VCSWVAIYRAGGHGRFKRFEPSERKLHILKSFFSEV
jgi:hypothetical protein